MIEKNIKFEKLNRNELHRYLGYKLNNTPDETVRGIIDKCEEKLFKRVKPSYIYRTFPINEAFEASVYKGIELVGTNLVLEGESIRKHLAGCSHAVLLVATLSAEADRLIRQSGIKDMAEALIMDTVASVAIEQVCEQAEAGIRKELSDKYMTYRFGVGYGDLPLEHEGMILDILNAGKLIGLYSSETNILIPRKSVVCVIGISDKPLPKGQKGCATCNMRESCSYRRQGLSCSY